METMIRLLWAGYAKSFSRLLGRQVQIIEIIKLVTLITRALIIVKLSAYPR